jgi:hypothetical protein
VDVESKSAEAIPGQAIQDQMDTASGPIDILPHSLHADAATGDLRELVAGGKPVLKNQIRYALRWILPAFDKEILLQPCFMVLIRS